MPTADDKTPEPAPQVPLVWADWQRAEEAVLARARQVARRITERCRQVAGGGGTAPPIPELSADEPPSPS
jgi:hypothetical protein